MKKIIAVITCIILLTLTLCGCKYNVPEGYTKEHHTYEEILAYAKTLDTDATVSKEYVDIEDEYGEHYREWPAVILGVECHVSSITDYVWNTGIASGEFCKKYYKTDTDFDYVILNQIIAENQPDWSMTYDDISSRYNRNNCVSVMTSNPENRKLTEKELETEWLKMVDINEKYYTYPVNKQPYFNVYSPSEVHNQADNETYVKRDGDIIVSHICDECKQEFFKNYEEAWALLDSGLRIE